MKSLTLPLGKIKLNDDNPRLIKDARFAQLVKSLQEFPEMLALRPLVVDESYTVLGGNMRLRAMQHLHFKEALVTVAVGLSEAQKREFVIKDNGSFGIWDFDQLANDWPDAATLNDWGMEVPTDWASDELADYSDKNKEVNLNDFDEKLEFKLKLTSDQFFDLQERLSVVKAKQNASTNEEAIFALLDFYEARA